jgi:LmbE family N-acetylglucosaminyl deacetylase
VTLRELDGAGTPESCWRDESGLEALPELTGPLPPRVVALAPHPDDDVLGAGGMLSLLGRRGVRVVPVGVTDGEGSHPEASSVTRSELAARRRREALAAHRVLGLRRRTRRLGLPDTRVAEHEDELATRLERILRPGDWCLAPFERDGHPDHDATGRAARSAAAARGAVLLSYLVWTWHWAVPGEPDVPWSDARSIRLDPATVAAKASAIAEFASQIEPLGPAAGDAPILTRAELEHHLRPFEVLLT